MTRPSVGLSSNARPPSSAMRSRFAWRSNSAPPRSPRASTPPTPRSASMWLSRCAQKPMLEPPTFWDTRLLGHSLVPLLDPTGSVRPRPMLMLKLMLMLMPSSLEGSPLLTTLPPLQDTLLEPSAPLPQLLPLLAQLPSAIPLLLLLLLLLLPSATLLLLLLHLLLLLTTSPLSASQSPGGSAGASPSRLPAPFKLPSASPCPSAPPSPDALLSLTVSLSPSAPASPSVSPCPTALPFPTASPSPSASTCPSAWQCPSAPPPSSA